MPTSTPMTNLKMPPSPYSSRSLGAHPSRPRLLLVEDDAPTRNTLTRSLGERFDVVALVDPTRAADHLTKQQFDVIVIDLHLCSVTGLDLLRAVRAQDPDVPVILLTALPDVDTAIKAMELGALAYIKKPFDAGALDAALVRATELVGLARARREVIAGDVEDVPRSRERATLEASFESALESMWIAFQPIVDGRSRKTIGFEALMRSHEQTMATPGAILDAAERLGRIHDVGRCVRVRAAEAFAQEDSDMLLFVNLHAADLDDEDLFDPDAPLTKLASRVVLEITERAAVGDVSAARRQAFELRRRGFRIAIDDLGQGYAGLTSFATFEPEIVKLDMMLVRGVESSAMKRLIVGRITTLCHDLDMRVVAEGIETADELSCMLDLGCEYLQGYLLGRPSAELRRSPYPWPAPGKATLRPSSGFGDDANAESRERIGRLSYCQDALP